MIFSELDVCDLIMQGHPMLGHTGIIVDSDLDLAAAATILDPAPQFVRYDELVEQLSTEEFDLVCQNTWYMPSSYQELDIAQYVLSLCSTDQELQRVAQELLMFQERDLFDLLRYIKYLVDTMRENNVIWGVGRGSSVASYVLYKLGLHRINSLHYDLDPGEFLR